MSDYRTPAVYRKEQDKSLYTRGRSTSVAGLIGVASSGPVGEPVLITSLAAFEEKFGGARLDSYLYHGVKAFFENRGGILYVVRTAHYADPLDRNSLTAVRSAAVVPGAPVTEGTTTTTPNALRVELDYGTRYEGYTLEVVVNADGSFDLVVRDTAGNVVENHRSLVSGVENVGNERHVEAYFPRGSLLGIVVDDLDVAPVAGTYTFAGGNDGLAGLVDGDFIGASSSKTGVHAFDSVDTVRGIAAPGVTSPAWIAALTAYCEGRQNIEPIVATPSGLTPQQAIDFRQGRGVYTHSAINSNYASLYWPWILQRDPATKRDIPVPPEGAVLGLTAYNDFVGHPWTAPAGPNRGIVQNALGVAYAADEGENAELYDAQINVIRSFPDLGVALWGQKTLTNKPSAFDRRNVRRLFIYAGTALADTSKYLLFEPNNPDTWEAFKRFARPILSDIQGKGGLFSRNGEPGFRVVCDETTNTPFYVDRNIMRALVYLRPTKAGEFIELVFVASDSGAGFENLSQF